MDGTLLDDAARQAAIVQLNVIVETELAGTVRYTHYALMVYGYNRIPIVSWLRSNAAESLAHAQRAGELIGCATNPGVQAGEG